MVRPFPRFDFHDEAPPVRLCESPGCGGEGIYRAPKAADRLREYHWFCLDHVREYNKSWNYCSGLSEAEIEQLIRADTQWERQTRPISHWQAHETRLLDALNNIQGGEEEERAKTERLRRESNTPEAKALRIFGLTPPVDYTSIKSRYIELVKLHHPDANGGDKAAEERLKTINQALQTLKAAYST